MLRHALSTQSADMASLRATSDDLYAKVESMRAASEEETRQLAELTSAFATFMNDVGSRVTALEARSSAADVTFAELRGKLEAMEKLSYGFIAAGSSSSSATDLEGLRSRIEALELTTKTQLSVYSASVETLASASRHAQDVAVRGDDALNSKLNVLADQVQAVIAAMQQSQSAAQSPSYRPPHIPSGTPSGQPPPSRHSSPPPPPARGDPESFDANALAHGPAANGAGPRTPFSELEKAATSRRCREDFRGARRFQPSTLERAACIARATRWHAPSHFAPLYLTPVCSDGPWSQPGVVLGQQMFHLSRPAAVAWLRLGGSDPEEAALICMHAGSLTRSRSAADSALICAHASSLARPPLSVLAPREQTLARCGEGQEALAVITAAPSDQLYISGHVLAQEALSVIATPLGKWTFMQDFMQLSAPGSLMTVEQQFSWTFVHLCASDSLATKEQRLGFLRRFNLCGGAPPTTPGGRRDSVSHVAQQQMRIASEWQKALESSGLEPFRLDTSLPPSEQLKAAHRWVEDVRIKVSGLMQQLNLSDDPDTQIHLARSALAWLLAKKFQGPDAASWAKLTGFRLLFSESSTLDLDSLEDRLVADLVPLANIRRIEIPRVNMFREMVFQPSWSVLQCYFHFTYELEKLMRADAEKELSSAEKLPTASEQASLFKSKLPTPIREKVETKVSGRPLKSDDIIEETGEPNYHFIKNLAVEAEAELIKEGANRQPAAMGAQGGAGRRATMHQLGESSSGADLSPNAADQDMSRKFDEVLAMVTSLANRLNIVEGGCHLLNDRLHTQWRLVSDRESFPLAQDMPTAAATPAEGVFQLALRPPPPPPQASSLESLVPLPRPETVLPRLLDESAPGIVQFVYQGDGLAEHTAQNIIYMVHADSQAHGHLAKIAKTVDISLVTDPGLDHLVAAYKLKRPLYRKEQCYCLIHGDTIGTLGPNAHDMDECFVLINNQEPFREMKKRAQMDAKGTGQREQRSGGPGGGSSRVNFGTSQQSGAAQRGGR